MAPACDARHLRQLGRQQAALQVGELRQQRALRAVALDRDGGRARHQLDGGELIVARSGGTVVVDRERADDLAVGRLDRRRPARTQSVAERQLAEVLPVGVGGDVRRDDRLPEVGRGAARADARGRRRSRRPPRCRRRGRLGAAACSRCRPSALRSMIDARASPSSSVSTPTRQPLERVARAARRRRSARACRAGSPAAARRARARSTSWNTETAAMIAPARSRTGAELTRITMRRPGVAW